MALLANDKLVTKPIAFFKGESVRIVVLDFTDVQGKLRP